MEEIFSKLTDLPASLIYTLVMVVTFIESTPVGIFLPGTLFLLLLGSISHVVDINIYYTILFALSGSVLGDIVGYLLGLKGNKIISKLSHNFNFHHALDKTKAFFYKHGGKSVLMGKFVGVVRPFVTIIAGSSKMNFFRFMLFNIISSTLWATLYISLGYLFSRFIYKIDLYMKNIFTIFFLVFIVILYIYQKKKKRL